MRKRVTYQGVWGRDWFRWPLKKNDHWRLSYFWNLFALLLIITDHLFVEPIYLLIEKKKQYNTSCGRRIKFEHSILCRMRRRHGRCLCAWLWGESFRKNDIISFFVFLSAAEGTFVNMYARHGFAHSTFTRDYFLTVKAVSVVGLPQNIDHKAVNSM